MSFGHAIDDVVRGVEAVGVGILVVGGLVVLLQGAARYRSPATRHTAYAACRHDLGRVILLGLEVLIVADIIRTVIVDQTSTSVAVLATIVAIRIALAWSLSAEIDGVWPWNKGRASAPRRGGPE